MQKIGLLCLCLILSSIVAHGSGWSQFRGPNGSAVAEDAKPPTELKPESNLKWKTALATGHSSPIQFRDRLIVNGTDGTFMITYAINMANGRVEWENRIGVEKLERHHGTNNAAPNSPVTDGNWVYVYHPSFGLVAYDYDGAEQWQKPLPMVKTPRNQGSGTSPVLAGDLLVIDRQLHGDTHLLAVNKKDGSEVWKAPRPLNSWSFATPILFEEAGVPMVGMAGKGSFIAYSLANGEQQWWVTGLATQVCASPVFVDGVLYISSSGAQGDDTNTTSPPDWDDIIGTWDTNKDGILDVKEIPDDILVTDRKTSTGAGNFKLRGMVSLFYKDLAKDGYTKVEWAEMKEKSHNFLKGPMNRPVMVAVRPGGKGDVTDTHVIWKESKRLPEIPSPVVYQGRVYNIRSGGILNCRDAETGKVIYDKRIGAPGGYFSSPIAANGHLYVANDRGEITVIKTGDEFQVVSKSELGEPVAASPAIVDDTLIFRSASNLWAFAN